ncbi:hypothetical protein [Gelidibacter salicanalis]|uniref:Uncharacterized protein n=1 Tax=Gelidibacter salicanalis TaxID=291193 RepID=A0A934KIP2_9FLAO|nr:hypothetical protein [Gelidibacter salicanalis]MBJ7880221.1 hypothetical protein [Gelidibacter salicanalis]
MGHIQKMILLVVIVPLALFPGGLISYVLLFEKPVFETTMWVPVGMTVLGICSFIFHFKSKSFYKLLKKEATIPKVETLFWVLDIAFGVIYMMMSIYLLYMMYQLGRGDDYAMLLYFIIPLFIIGVWTVGEAFYLNKLIQIHKFAHRHSEIEDIKGEGLE